MTNRNAVPYILFVPSMLVLLMVVTAVAWPNGDVRRVLFAVGFCVAVILALACIFVGWAHLHAVEDAVVLVAENTDRIDARAADVQADLVKLRSELAKHVAFCDAPPDLDDTLRLLVEQSRSA
jgi:hypothetical protein